MPDNDPLLRHVLSMRRNVKDADMDKYAEAGSGLHEYIDHLQAQLGELHNAITARYFSLDVRMPEHLSAEVQ